MRASYDLDRELADGYDVARLNSMNQRTAGQVMLFQLALGKARREVRTINRHVELFQDERQRAQMVLVTVGKDNGGNVLAVFFENIEVGDADVDAIDALFGKAHARVDDEHLITAAHKGAIHPKLADTAEGDDLQDITHFWFLLYFPNVFTIEDRMQSRHRIKRRSIAQAVNAARPGKSAADGCVTDLSRSFSSEPLYNVWPCCQR